MGLHQTRDLHDERNRMKKPTERRKALTSIHLTGN